MAINKKYANLGMIFTGSVRDGIEQIKQEFINYSGVSDPVRLMAGSYLVVDNGELKMAKEAEIPPDMPNHSFRPLIVRKEPGYYGWQERHKIIILRGYGHRPNAQQTNKLQLYAQSRGIKFDEYYKKEVPQDKDELSIDSAAQYVDVNSFYNFYAESYENIIASDAVSENVLPNFYTLFAEKMHGNDVTQYALQSYWTPGTTTREKINTLNLNFPIPGSAYDRMGLLDAVSVQPNDAGAVWWTKTNAGSRYLEYFTKYADSLGKILQNTNTNPIELAEFGEKHKTFIFDYQGAELLRQDATNGQMFPMHNKISFTTGRDNRNRATLADYLAEHKLETLLLRLAASQDREAESQDAPTSTAGVSTNKDGIATYQEADNVPLILDQSRYDNNSPVSGLEDSPTNRSVLFWLNSLRDRAYEKMTPLDFVFIGSQGTQMYSAEGEYYLPGYSPPMEEARLNQLINFVGKMEREKGRTIEEYFSGKEAYHETVFFKIEKFAYPNNEGENSSTTPISRYYVPNSSNMSVCNLIDTQVKYGKRYKYVVTSYDLVISTRIQYPGWYDGTQLGENRSEFDAVAYIQNYIDASTNRGTIGYYFNFATIKTNVITTLDNVVVMDKPPMPPEVTVVPYRDSENKILVNLNSSVGDRDLVPIMIDSSEEDNILSLENSQRRTDNKLRFKSDDTPGFFEVYRTTKKPKTYQDFAATKIMEISTGQESTSAAFNDMIEPNVDYYYTFRTKDVHGNLSNPSVIYNLKMNDTDNGPHFLDISILDLEAADSEKEAKSAMKAMRRYVQILPTVPQGILNTEASGISSEANSVQDVDSVTLGVAEESLWGKRFKVRFTSKKTGRKVDLDIKFTTEHV